MQTDNKKLIKKGTKTSKFGTNGRINHDSSDFYNSNLYNSNNDLQIVEYKEAPIDEKYVNCVINKSSVCMSELPNNSVHLMVTSPPYNVGKEYDNNLSISDYRNILRNVFTEVFRVLVSGGRICINIANLGRKPYIPLHCFIVEDLINIGFHMRGEIIWDKGNSASPSTAWGSYLKANNPVLRDIHEYILVFSKDSFSLQNQNNKKSTISRDEFLEFTKSIWRFSAERASKVGHPAPFPIELPYRLIQLYSYENDVVLDPFVGSGTTCIASIKTNRRYIGYDINKDYCELAKQRLNNYINNNNSLY